MTPPRDVYVISSRAARRLALVRAGLWKPELVGLPSPRAGRGSGRRARDAAHQIVEHFGYLQLDSISVIGARTHTLVLLSRLDNFDPSLGEQLLVPGEPLFEYWGHEASWMPMSLFPTMGFRRRAFRSHRWWKAVVEPNRKLARDIVKRIRDEGPLRTRDFEGASGAGFWDLDIVRRILPSLWSAGDLAIRTREHFHREFDLPERVVPAGVRKESIPKSKAYETLILRALDGHGWASKSTITQTFRLRRDPAGIASAFRRLTDRGDIIECDVERGSKRDRGYVRPKDLPLIESLERGRPSGSRPVLLSPFDPLLWDRDRLEKLFGFEQRIEIYTPKPKRRYGYYCLPVLQGEELVGRVDLKAHRKQGRLEVISEHAEPGHPAKATRDATRSATARLADQLGLTPTR